MMERPEPLIVRCGSCNGTVLFKQTSTEIKFFHDCWSKQQRDVIDARDREIAEKTDQLRIKETALINVRKHKTEAEEQRDSAHALIGKLVEALRPFTQGTYFSQNYLNQEALKLLNSKEVKRLEGK